MLADDAESTFTEREDFDRQFFSLVALTRSLLGASNNGVGSEAGFKDADSGAHISSRNNFVRLPKIELPHFDGNYQSWLEFRDTFSSLVHDNASINAINKFHYLRASLQSKAALIIKNIDFKAEHYQLAWDLLCERFNNNRLLVDNHLRALFDDVEPILTESSVGIRNLVDLINKNIRALTTLKKPTQHWDLIIIYFMVKKLDSITRRDWEENRNTALNNDDPTLQQFCSFLGKRADWLESVESNNCSSKHNSIVALNNSHINKINSKTNTQIQKQQNKKSNYNHKNNKCPLCSQVHTLYRCDSFRSLSIEARIQKVTGINNHVSTSTQSCHLTIESLCCAFAVDIDCHILPEITKVLPSSFVHISHVPIPSGLVLADPNFNVPSVVDILVGADVFWNVIGNKTIDLGKHLPTLCETKLGWLVSGSVSHSTSLSSNHCCHHSSVTPDLTYFWELDNVSSKHSNSLEERMCEQLFAQNTFRNNDGKFVVTMPLKGDPSSLGHSYLNARNRFLSLERRFERDPSFKRKYIEFIKEYEHLGHMTLDSDCTPSPENSITKYYIPHHGVIRSSSTTTQLRVVFDASAPTSTGVSLNDIQMVGPVVQDELFSIITRFRQHRYVVSGDVEKMYRAIELNPIQRPLQKIIFRFDPSEPLRTYTLNTVTYGTASAPYLATKCLVSLADNIEDERVQSAIRRDFYVDDFLSGGETIAETIEIAKKVQTVLSSAKFNLRKWRSNHPEIHNQITDSNVLHNRLHFSEQGTYPTPSKTLGLIWVCDSDTLTYSINITSTTKVTKRHVLSVISQIFDPLGLVGPCVVEAKLIMQRLWLEKYDWDDVVSLDIENIWSTFVSSITSLNRLNVPRWVLREDSVIHEVHIFTDASEKAYGACVYIRSCSSDGSMSVQLLVSRNRVAPIKPTTIPRLELCGALLGARLCAKVQESLTIPIHKCRFWCDSTIVLAWLSTDSSQLKPFVKNRVNEIQEITFGHTWSYVPSKDNPADLVSRGLRADVIKDTPLWWSGPSFLKHDETENTQHRER